MTSRPRRERHQPPDAPAGQAPALQGRRLPTRSATRRVAGTSPSRVFYTLTVTRWLPVGLMTGILILLATTRGLSIAEALTYAAVTGVVCFALELPTSGFADAFGRRPVYLAAAVLNVVTALAYVVAHSFWAFVAAAALMGAFRALDSGPLEAWFVDKVHEEHPGKDVDQELARSGTLMGAAVALGALLSGLLIWWHPLGGQPALDLVVWVFLAGNLVHLLAVALLLRDAAGPSAGSRSDATGAGRSTWVRARASVREAPAVIRDGLRIMVRSRALLGILAAEAAWSVGMVAFESLLPIRLADLLGSAQDAGALLGPVTAVAWGVFALGTWLAGILSRRVGVARAAMAGRFLNSAGIIAMALALGPASLLAAYLFTYSMHGLNGPPHGALLHREASAANRSTILSLNSMVAFLAFAAASPAAGLLSEHRSIAATMFAIGAVSMMGVLAYLPARRAERNGLRTGAVPDAG